MRNVIEQLALVGLVIVCGIAAWAELTQYKTCAPPMQKVPAQQWRQV